MKIKLLFALICAALIFTGCAPEQTDEDSGNTYEGTWTRTAIYANDTEYNTPATLTLTNDTFISGTSLCSASGGLDIKEEENKMIMIMIESDCPGAQVPFIVTYTYSIADKLFSEETLTLTTENSKEIYVRN
ncbi:hypothetical protein KJ742_05650 [Patescibacteria group bacterium]|nr:hypothetical protein [Patescibacteria group bacterium]MBU1683402.1 hypothetical protein [Patescibacteria group bacterium]MBU1934910.1 hypothetical protein [Patescibacteria group bacterium]